MPSITRNTVADQFDLRIDLGAAVEGFKMLTPRIGTNVVRRGLLQGARVIGEDARARAPQPKAKTRRRKAKGPGRPKKSARRVALRHGDRGYYATGNLKRSIGWETRGVFKDSSGVPVEHRAVVIIKKPKGKTQRRNARVYAHLVEYGTKPHHVGKGAITHVYKGSKKKAQAIGAKHPGSRAQPFMGPAFRAKSDESIRTIERVVVQELDKEIDKIKIESSWGKVARR